MEFVSQDIIDKFNAVTKIDIKQFFSDYISFIENHYPKIVEYYSGSTKTINSTAFNTLNSLVERSKIILDQFISNEYSFDCYEFWIMLEQVEDIQAQLHTTLNLRRWLRSNQTNNGFVNSPTMPYIAKQQQNLEEIETYVNGSQNPQEDWVTTALENNLREEDYTQDGGYLIKINFKNADIIKLDSVVDSIDSIEKSYGLDLDRTLQFVNSDLKVLSHKETLYQSAYINATLKKGDNPASPSDGIDEKRSIGGNIAGIAYPTLFREIANVFAKDDIFKAFTILDVKRDQDAVFIDFQVETRAGDILKRTIQI